MGKDCVVCVCVVGLVCVWVAGGGVVVVVVGCGVWCVWGRKERGGVYP